MKKRILFVVGTRPEIIKTASVVQELKKDKSFRVGVCLSGQHISMVTQMLEDFNIKPDYDLKIMKDAQSLITIKKNLIPVLDEVYDNFKPDLVFVQGDTTTALIAALVAFYKKIKVAHIEAGLRTFDRNFPFPEEMNRILITRLTDLHFAPTRAARSNLVREGVSRRSIFVTGNTGIDSLKYIIDKEYDFIDKHLQKMQWDRKIILLTAHRRENFGKGLADVFKAAKKIASKYEDILVIYPVHPNPNVQKPANRLLSGAKNVLLLNNLHYRDLVKLMKVSHVILTDSGGIQEEAPSLGKPVLILPAIL